MARCAGCRPRNKKCAYLKKWCPELAESRVTYCFDCKSFPCHRLRTIDKRYKTRYKMSMIDNLQYIKEYGTGEFLETQEKLWKCMRCRGMICCHNGLCFNCNSEKLRSKKQKYRWNEE